MGKLHPVDLAMADKTRSVDSEAVDKILPASLVGQL